MVLRWHGVWRGHDGGMSSKARQSSACRSHGLVQQGRCQRSAVQQLRRDPHGSDGSPSTSSALTGQLAAQRPDHQQQLYLAARTPTTSSSATSSRGGSPGKILRPLSAQQLPHKHTADGARCVEQLLQAARCSAAVARSWREQLQQAAICAAAAVLQQQHGVPWGMQQPDPAASCSK